MDRILTCSRRRLIASSAASGLMLFAPAVSAAADRFAPSPWRKLSQHDWMARLSPAAYRILREEGTEPPGSSPLLAEHRKGVFACAGCGLPLFKSEWKFESGTGWPSFYTVLHDNIGEKNDRKIAEARIEYHCARCLGHQGHVFNDGPKPTGLRYCNDGLALRFLPA
jgi:peptide-methionine (R)-S-oxide reductase